MGSASRNLDQIEEEGIRSAVSVLYLSISLPP
ncbi:uncharacterized protein METZ01_LOCUS413610, partial [marine metagenome]